MESEELGLGGRDSGSEKHGARFLRAGQELHGVAAQGLAGVRQLDADANRMAAFTAEDPSDGKAFAAHGNRILADETIVIKTVLFDGRVAGNVSSFAHPTRDKPHELVPEQKGRRS